MPALPDTIVDLTFDDILRCILHDSDQRGLHVAGLIDKSKKQNNPIYIWAILDILLGLDRKSEIPNECFDYIKTVAGNIKEIACEEIDKTDTGSATKAANKLAGALLFTSNGRNAFKDARRELLAKSAAAVDDYLRTNRSISAAQRVAIIQKVTKVGGERQATRLVQEGRSGRRIKPR